MIDYQEVINHLQERYEYFSRLEFNHIAADYKIALDALTELTATEKEESEETKI